VQNVYRENKNIGASFRKQTLNAGTILDNHIRFNGEKSVNLSSREGLDTLIREHVNAGVTDWVAPYTNVDAL